MSPEEALREAMLRAFPTAYVTWTFDAPMAVTTFRFRMVGKTGRGAVNVYTADIGFADEELADVPTAALADQWIHQINEFLDQEGVLNEFRPGWSASGWYDTDQRARDEARIKKAMDDHQRRVEEVEARASILATIRKRAEG